MAYKQFMYDEAFDFHNEQDVRKLKQDNWHTHDDDDDDDCINEVVSDGAQRLPPLGACSNEPIEQQPKHQHSFEGLEIEKFLQLQDDHEQLNTSLFALTSHFAQVQFRLKQIISGPKDDQEQLLEELEDFAFTGCPDVLAPSDKGVACSSCISQTAISQYQQRIEDEKERERRLDSHLKKMISDLEICQKNADRRKQSSHKSMPVKPMKGYQRLSQRLERSTKIDVGESDHDTDNDGDGDDDATDRVSGQDDLKKYVDKTMAKLINPRQAKDVIISQVSKQISDMEKFVDFLNSYNSSSEEVATTDKPTQSTQPHIHSRNTASASEACKSSSKKRAESRGSNDTIPAPHTRMLKRSEDRRKRVHEASVAVMKKGLALLQIFAISQFGCSAKHFQEHMMSRTETATVSKTGHMKPLAQLRSAIDHIMLLHTKLVDVGGLHPDSEDELNLPISSTDKRASWSRARSRSLTRTRNNSTTSVTSTHSGYKSVEASVQEELIRVVRGDFAVALKELLQHGMFESFRTRGLSTKALVGCMSSNMVQGHDMHVWEYFGNFYAMKHGQEFNTQPSMMLSEAFAMDVGCTQQTPKQSLLTVFHRIKTTHESRKRSYDAMFKALISAGLNRGRLAQWIRLVIRMPELVERHYEKWSYVVKSGFDEVLTLLEKLSSLTFFLPEDLAIRHLLKNTNEFGDA